MGASGKVTIIPIVPRSGAFSNICLLPLNEMSKSSYIQLCSLPELSQKPRQTWHWKSQQFALFAQLLPHNLLYINRMQTEPYEHPDFSFTLGKLENQPAGRFFLSQCADRLGYKSGQQTLSREYSMGQPCQITEILAAEVLTKDLNHLESISALSNTTKDQLDTIWKNRIEAKP